MVLLVMGVAGSGKTTVGSVLAKKLHWPFLDADDFHSPANREKMHRGIPLTDEDRLPWLRSIHEELAGRASKGENAVLACSALRQSYRGPRQSSCTSISRRGRTISPGKISFPASWQRSKSRQMHWLKTSGVRRKKSLRTFVRV